LSAWGWGWEGGVCPASTGAGWMRGQLGGCSARWHGSRGNAMRSKGRVMFIAS